MERRGNGTRRRQEAQLDKESKKAFFERGGQEPQNKAHGIHKDRKEFFFVCLPLLYIHYIFEGEQEHKGIEGD